MLKPEDNVRLTRVGPGTPGGELFRRYWQPALLASEVAENDGPPVKVRLLCEDLIAFRDSNGKVGLIEAFCPHRRAPFYFGRNEACGITCSYHGWKFDVNGDCVDMPTEQPESKMKDRVKLTAYPTVELGGVIWTYMGPKETMPAPPDYEWLRVPHTHCHVSKTYQECNYLQALEGGLDTAHSSYAHNNDITIKTQMRQIDRAPRLDVEPTEYGYSYVSHRNLGDNNFYVRLYHFVMPAQQMRGGIHKFDGKRKEFPVVDGHIWAPIDDEQTHVFNWHHGYDISVPLTEEHIDEAETFYGRGPQDMIPGTFRLKKNKSNDYGLDRELQRTKVFTGITGINTQDFALQEGMGPICDRSKEHLGSTDRAIITLRRLLLEATYDVADGKAPRGSAPQSHNDMRPYDNFVKAGDDWKAIFAPEIKAKF
jgi:phthalate 4,5-dioxygenase oxygenase subunit